MLMDSLLNDKQIENYVNCNVNDNVNVDINNLNYVNVENVNVDDIYDLLFRKLKSLGVDEDTVHAEEICKKLHDNNANLHFYLKVIRTIGFQKAYEICASVVEAHSRGMIRTTMPQYFIGVLKRKGILWKGGDTHD